MKLIMLSFLIMSTVFAHEIIGTKVLKGKARGAGQYQGEKVDCTINISEIKNEMMEDQFGNPSYKISAEIKVETQVYVGGKKRKTKIEKLVNFTNRTIQTNLVSDTDYRSIIEPVGVNFKIDGAGKIISMTTTIAPNTQASCNF